MDLYTFKKSYTGMEFANRKSLGDFLWYGRKWYYLTWGCWIAKLFYCRWRWWQHITKEDFKRLFNEKVDQIKTTHKEAKTFLAPNPLKENPPQKNLPPNLHNIRRLINNPQMPPQNLTLNLQTNIFKKWS